MLMLLQLAVISLSSIGFSLLNECFPECLTVDAGRRVMSSYEAWKWRNILISLIHSTLSGVCAFYLTFECIVGPTDLVHHLQRSYSGRVLICFSIGYFIYDSLLSWSVLQRYPGRVEIIVHHIITMATLAMSLTSNEVMKQLSGRQKTIKYELNSVLVIASIVIFRYLPLYWISYDLYYVLAFPSPLLALLYLPIVALAIISGIILYRTIVEDFFA